MLDGKLLTTVPLYCQLSNLLEKEIADGKWKTGDKIPSEAELSKMFSVSRITVRAAIDELVENGMLVKIQGKGTFVINESNKNLLSIGTMSFVEMCRENNMTPGRVQISKEMAEADSGDMVHLHLKRGDRVLVLKRILLANDQPLIIATDRIRPDFSFLMEKDLEKLSLNQCMIDSGRVRELSPVERSIEVCMASVQEAEWLKIRAGVPLLMLRDIAVDEKGNPVRRTKELLIADKIRITY